MKIRLLALTATTAALAIAAASSASAASYTVTTTAGMNISQPLITDFNSDQAGNITDLAAGYTFSQGGNGLAFTRDGALGLESGVSAPPPGETAPGSYYETVLGNGGVATLTSDQGLKTFQFYLGSPDDYNQVKFTFVDMNNNAVTLSGAQIWGGNPNGSGDQSVGYTVTYNFDTAVKSISFTSGDQNAFEFDKLAGGVPEPASWALMIVGFGGAGAAMRGQRRRQTAAAAA